MPSRRQRRRSLREAATTGKLTLRPRAQVLRIETDATGRARAVVWRDETGTERQSRGKAIVVAAGAIQTARLLLPLGPGDEVGPSRPPPHPRHDRPPPRRPRLPHPVFGVRGGKHDFPFAERAVRTDDGAIVWYMPGVNPIHDAEEAAKQGDGKPRSGAPRSPPG